jgi:hypothetical protein
MTMNRAVTSVSLLPGTTGCPSGIAPGQVLISLHIDVDIATVENNASIAIITIPSLTSLYLDFS